MLDGLVKFEQIWFVEDFAAVGARVDVIAEREKELVRGDIGFGEGPGWWVTGMIQGDGFGWVDRGLA